MAVCEISLKWIFNMSRAIENMSRPQYMAKLSNIHKQQVESLLKGRLIKDHTWIFNEIEKDPIVNEDGHTGRSFNWTFRQSSFIFANGLNAWLKTSNANGYKSSIN